MVNINSTYAQAITFNKRIRFLVLHYTAQNFETSLELLTKRVSAHYLVSLNRDDDPSYPFEQAQIFNLVDEQDRAWHAGVSNFGGRSNLNDTSIGIEIVNLVQSTDHFLPYPDYQVHLVSDLCKDILKRNPDITPDRVLGHSDIALGRKSDPGPLFPWKALYDRGVGAWFEQSDVDFYQNLIEAGRLNKVDALKKIEEYGYPLVDTESNDQALETVNKKMIEAFQMHFRASSYNGILDHETAAIMFALYVKYKAKPDDALVRLKNQ